MLTAVGGWSALARGLGVRRQSLDWTRVPRDRLLTVARLAGLEPAEIRPDLAEWAAGERLRARMARARSMFALGAASIIRGRPAPPCYEDEVAGDMLIALAACRWVATERELTVAQVMTGRLKADQAARAYAMALAHVVGRARSGTVGILFGTTRQNVDNASERYLRARDGDDVDDFIAPGRVIERGRLRRAKTPQEDLWDAEARFSAALAAKPERKSA